MCLCSNVKGDTLHDSSWAMMSEQVLIHLVGHVVWTHSVWGVPQRVHTDDQFMPASNVKAARADAALTHSYMRTLPIRLFGYSGTALCCTDPAVRKHKVAAPRLPQRDAGVPEALVLCALLPADCVRRRRRWRQERVSPSFSPLFTTPPSSTVTRPSSRLRPETPSIEASRPGLVGALV